MQSQRGPGGGHLFRFLPAHTGKHIRGTDENAVDCNVPHRYIREMVTGVPEETGMEPDGEGGKEHVDTDTE